MLAVEPSQRCELVQDLPSLTPAASPVPLARNRDQFVPRCHAHPPHCEPRQHMLPGSFLDEATDGHRGAFQPRQCSFPSRLSRSSSESFESETRSPPASKRSLTLEPITCSL